MAGMRLYGYQQRKKTNIVRRGSASPSSGDAEAEQESAEAAKDEEYKLVYHQTYKGAVFAFRRSIASTPLQTQPNKIRDTVDRLLAIFCTDPLAAPEVAIASPGLTLTPAGHPLMDPNLAKSPFEQLESEGFPWSQPSVGQSRTTETQTRSCRSYHADKSKGGD